MSGWAVLLRQLAVGGATAPPSPSEMARRRRESEWIWQSAPPKLPTYSSWQTRHVWDQILLGKRWQERITLTRALILWATEGGHQSSSSWCELKWPRR